MKNILISSLCLLSLNCFANITGTYDIKRGFAETHSISQLEQLGKYRLVMKDANRNKLKIKGIMRGKFDPSTQTSSHTLVNTERTGTLITAEDFFTNIYAGDPVCANGVVPFEVEERLNIVSGTGIYAGVQPGSYIIVQGVINNCPCYDNFLQNDFSVTGGVITFN